MSEAPDAVARFFGGLLLATGALIAFVSGGCTLTFTVIAVIESIQLKSMASFAALPMFLIVGGLTCAAGLLAVRAGRRMRGGGRRKETS
jgi:hypothetical protein